MNSIVTISNYENININWEPKLNKKTMIRLNMLKNLIPLPK